MHFQITTYKKEYQGFQDLDVATPLWDKCEDEIHTPKSGDLESSGTPATLELNFKGQNTSSWGFIYTVEKLLRRATSLL